MKNEDEKNGELYRKEFSGLVLPYLEYIYAIFAENFIKKHELKIVSEFWIFLTMGIFSIILYFTGVNIILPLGFFFGAFLIFMLHNNSFIRRKWFPRQDEKVEVFLKTIDNKTLNQTLKTLKDNTFRTKQIIELLKTKYNKNYQIYEFILRYQGARTEVLSYIISKELYNNFDEGLFSKFLLKNCSLAKDDYLRVKNLFKNKKAVLKALMISNPGYIEENSIFKKLSMFRYKVKNSIKYGLGGWLLFLVALIISGMIFSQINLRDYIQGSNLQIIIVNIFGIFMSFMTLLVFTAITLKLLIDFLMFLYLKIITLSYN